MAVTIKDIAHTAGVSHTTVSRALRNHPSIAPHTIERIQQIADEMGYVPNIVARDLKNNRSSVMGVIVRRIVDPFFSEVLDGIESVLSHQGYSIFLAQSNRDPQKEDAIIRSMSEQRVAGVIICSTSTDQARRDELLRFGVPSVVVNNHQVQDMNFAIYNDDIYGIVQIMAHLHQLGHRKIAYIGNRFAGREKVERLAGFREKMADFGLKIPDDFMVEGHNGRPAGGAEGVSQLLDLPQLPTAIVCFNDMMAVGALNRLKQAGFTVPEDISVTGFDNIEIASYVDPPLTTFNQPKFDLGRQAAMMMMNLIQAPGLKLDDTEPVIRRPINPIISLRGQLIERQSTAPPNPDLNKGSPK